MNGDTLSSEITVEVAAPNDPVVSPPASDPDAAAKAAAAAAAAKAAADAADAASLPTQRSLRRSPTVRHCRSASSACWPCWPPVRSRRRIAVAFADPRLAVSPRSGESPMPEQGMLPSASGHANRSAYVRALDADHSRRSWSRRKRQTPVHVRRITGNPLW
jgi:hypothetical protein